MNDNFIRQMNNKILSKIIGCNEMGMSQGSIAMLNLLFFIEINIVYFY